MRIQIDEAGDLCRRAFLASGASEQNGTVTAEALVRAEADGQQGHGLSRVPSYAAQVKTGKLNGARFPGTGRLWQRARSNKQGLEVPVSLIGEIKALAV